MKAKINNKKLLKANSLLETSKLLNSETEIKTILDTLLNKSLELTPGGDMGAIFLQNEKTGELEIFAARGMGDEVKGVSLQVGESMTGIAFEKQETIFFKDSQMVQQIMGEMRPGNQKLAVAGNVIAAEIRSSICCPLIYKNKVIGVLVVDNTNKANSLQEEDVDFLTDISVQATIAIINARNYEKQRQANQKLKKYNQIIQHQKDKYEHSYAIHNKLTNMILTGSSIDDILSELKKIIEHNLFIVDLFYNLNHHSHLSSKKLTEISQVFSKLIKHLRNTKSIFIDSQNNNKYSIFPIIVNQEIMGWLCILSKQNHQLGEMDIIAAERATTIIALELIKKVEINDMEQSLKGDFLDSLIYNNDAEYINKCAHRYGFNFEKTHRILVIKLDINNKSEHQTKKLLKKYYQSINKKTKEFFPQAISLIKRNMIVIIVEADQQKRKSIVKKYVAELEQIYSSILPFKKENFNFKIGVSNSFAKIADFKKSYFNALQVLEMIKQQAKLNFAYYEELEVKRLLRANKEEELKKFSNKILAPLKNYGNSSQNDFNQTLKIYLQSNCNWTLTKNKLHIHGNTLTYRLNRIKEILAINLDDYQDRLKLQVAYEIEELYNEKDQFDLTAE
jgi:sugar diacid utilization regulator/putative methionine-R-sulfoxide reductase with GAF domain